MSDEASRSEIAGLIRESAEAYVTAEETVLRARRTREGDGGFDAARWQAMAELGWTAMLLPEHLGGGGLSLADAAVLHEELGRGLAGGALALAGHLPVLAMSRAAGPAAPDVVAGMAAGAGPCALVFQPRGGVLHIADTPIGLVDERAAGGMLQGEAHHVPAGDVATLLVAARTATGTALYRVAPDAAGLRRDGARTADGAGTWRLVFDHVRVTERDLVTPPEQSAMADRALDEARILLAAELLGLMRETLARTLDYLRTRKQFGRPIGSFQALQHRAVDLHVQIELSAGALAHALAVAERDADPAALAVAASGVKVRASDAALLVTREAIQLHGAIGYTREHDIGLFLDRAVTLGAALGNAAAHRRRYGLLLSRTLAA